MYCLFKENLSSFVDIAKADGFNNQYETIWDFVDRMELQLRIYQAVLKLTTYKVKAWLSIEFYKAQLWSIQPRNYAHEIQRPGIKFLSRETNPFLLLFSVPRSQENE